ncbi:MAG: aminopeptidase N [Reinekea sp.]|jgi:aminopeptidase N
MRTETPVTIRLKDYQPPAYWIKNCALIIRIFANHTEVDSTLTMVRNGDPSELPALVLDGVEQLIQSLSFDGEAITDYDYQHDRLTVQPTQAEFTFNAVTHIFPNTNTSLEGLYKSGTMVCTQCEAEGFRKITFYLDRPDVMATFSTRIEADQAPFPILLANGNPTASGELEQGRHFATWDDPFAKPAYLFATVAGDLVRRDDAFTTASGRDISLRIFAEPHNAHKTEFALTALKKSMRWDEERFGREYDLDIFMIVASDFFNMGAMENKGLNIFNSAAVLATPETASDDRFERIEGIVAHEYFHNWSGNRVTCRDWFQLSLKEGFTVYRDAEFTSDLHDRAVKRIKDVLFLKNHQFPQDGGPNAHPVQPQEYIEINNFYTVTVYEKGAEIVGMLHTLLGDRPFRQACDLYFERFDGMAVTTDDFVDCMAQISGQDFSQFKRWYTQAGTPVVAIREDYDASLACYRLTFTQSCPATPGQSDKQPLVIPVKMALLDSTGQALPIDCDGDYNADTQVLTLTEAVTTVTFQHLASQPTPSLFRDFSAPVRVRLALSDPALLLLAQHDDNAFNRFEAVQQVYLGTLLKLTRGELDEIPALVDTVVLSILSDTRLSHALQSVLLSLPSYQQMMDNLDTVDAEAVIVALDHLKLHLAQTYHSHWATLSQSLASADAYVFTADEVGRRELQGLALHYWVLSGDKLGLNSAEALYRAAQNQTDRLNGLKAVMASPDRDRQQRLLVHFYRHWHQDTQMVETWLALQAGGEGIGVTDILLLMAHDAFDFTNPNKVRSVLGGFTQNFKAFHDVQGEGYNFISEQIVALNAINPQVAARFVGVFERWRKFAPERSAAMHSALTAVLETESLSPDVLELVQKTLA